MPFCKSVLQAANHNGYTSSAAYLDLVAKDNNAKQYYNDAVSNANTTGNSSSCLTNLKTFLCFFEIPECTASNCPTGKICYDNSDCVSSCQAAFTTSCGNQYNYNYATLNQDLGLTNRGNSVPPCLTNDVCKTTSDGAADPTSTLSPMVMLAALSALVVSVAARKLE